MKLAQIAVLALLPISSTLAFTFVVDTTVDSIDLSPGDGLCAAMSGCSLRAAIEEANAWPGADTIIVPAGTYALTLEGSHENSAASGDLDVHGNLTIHGAGSGSSIIDGNKAGASDPDRIFDIFTGYSVTLSGLTLQNGKVSGSGGALLNRGSTLTLADSAVLSSEASGTQEGGGGIANQGDLTLTRVTIDGNSSASNGGGLSQTVGSSTISYSTISANTAQSNAGGISLLNGTMTLDHSSVAGNRAVLQLAGGINNAATLTITSSTISNNEAPNQGAGIRSAGSSSTTLTMTNSTVSGNATPDYYPYYDTTTPATSGDAGGLYLGGSATLTNVSIINNRANIDGGGLYIASPTVTLKNSLVSGNVSGYSTATSANNCFLLNPLVTGDFNVVDDNSCTLGGSNDLEPPAPNTAPLALASNGGATLTHALPTGDPAIDRPSSACPASDQRDFARDANCDAGAFEVSGGDIDLAIQGYVTNNPVQLGNGSGFTHVVDVTNLGPSTATNATLTVTLAGSISVTSMPGNCTGSAPNLSCSIASLAAGSSSQYVFDLSSSTTGTLSSSYQLAAGGGQIDLNAANDAVTLDTLVDQSTDVALGTITATTPSAPNAYAGEVLTYTIPVSNGGATARAVTLTLQLPAGLTAAGVSADVGTCTSVGTRFTCNLGDMGDGATRTVTASASIGATVSGTVTALAYLNHGGTDLQPGNNSAAIDTFIGAQADLALTASVSASSAYVGNPLTQTFLVTNNGPSYAPATELSITLPAGLTLAGITAGSWSCNSSGNPIVCTLATLDAGSSASVAVAVTSATPGNYVSNGAISATGLDLETNASNDTTTATVDFLAVPTTDADLSVTASASPDPGLVGKNLRYTFTVLNDGPDDAIESGAATTLVATTLPAGMQYVSADYGCSAPVSNVVSCDVGNLAAGTEVSMDIVLLPTATGTRSIVSTVSTTTAIDGNPGNDSHTLAVNVSATPSSGGGGGGGSLALSRLGLDTAALDTWLARHGGDHGPFLALLQPLLALCAWLLGHLLDATLLLLTGYILLRNRGSGPTPQATAAPGRP